MDKFTLVIEMGSANTVIYKIGEGIVLKEASILLIERSKNSEAVVAVGNKIKKSKVFRDNEHVIYPIQNGVITDLDNASIMLKKFLVDIGEYKFFKKPSILFLVPCGLTLEEKNDYRNIAYLIGINNVDVMPSAVASMTGLSINAEDTKSHLIVNIGASTDIALISEGKIIDGCSVSIGGDSIDEHIHEYILKNKDIDMDRFSVENVKIDIGTLIHNDIRSMKICGNDSMGDYKEDTISSTEIYDILDREYSYITDAISSILSKCNSNSIKDIVDNGMYLIGASSKMTGISEFFASKLNIVPVKLSDNAEAITIVGAGNLLNNDLYLSELILLNRTEGE